MCRLCLGAEGLSWKICLASLGSLQRWHPPLYRATGREQRARRCIELRRAPALIPGLCVCSGTRCILHGQRRKAPWRHQKFASAFRTPPGYAESSSCDVAPAHGLLTSSMSSSCCGCYQQDVEVGQAASGARRSLLVLQILSPACPLRALVISASAPPLVTRLQALCIPSAVCDSLWTVSCVSPARGAVADP